MPETFDVVVIGSGSAAGEMERVCREGGLSVALIDSKPFGGTCALRGCDPKKVLVGAADLVDWSRRMAPHGVAGELRIDWPALMQFKRSFTDPVPLAKEKSYAEQGITAIHGRARFLSPEMLEVSGRQLTAAHFAIGAGMRPQDLKIPGQELLADSEYFLNMDELPKRIVFVGGGYIAFEFAHLSALAGAEVTIVNGGKPLSGFDPDLVDALIEKTRKMGIRVELGANVTGIEKANRNLIVRAAVSGYEADLAVHAAGRVPDLADMNLEAAGVECSRKGIRVNQFLQSTTNPRVYAAGDCADTGNAALTPVAGWEGRNAGANIVKPESSPLTPHLIPSVAFTLPPLARVGKTEAELKNGGVEYTCVHERTGGWYSSKRVGEDTGQVKVILEKTSGRILGAHLLGGQMEELVNVFALAIRAGLTRGDLQDQIFAYPTHASDIRYMV